MTVLYRQSRLFCPEDTMKNVWENPEIQQLNRLVSRSPLIPYRSAENAEHDVAAGPESVAVPSSDLFQSLDGTWSFALLDSPLSDGAGSAFEGWQKGAFDYSSWKDIKVPGSWTVQGFNDTPHYTNVQMPFDVMPPNVPAKNPTGLYRRKIQIPAQWKDRRIVFHVGSAESTLILYVNGELAGVSKDTRLPAEFNITPYLTWDGDRCDAEIAIKVVRYSDASFIEDQDQWWFGGIHRSVYLYATEEYYIEDIEAITRAENLSGDGLRGHGVLPLVVTLGWQSLTDDASRVTNAEMDSKTCVIQYTVKKLGGKASCGQAGETVASGSVQGSFNYRKDLRQATADIVVENALLWSSEHPELYIVTVTMAEDKGNGEAGRVIESVSFTTGFKKVALANRELLLNGRKVYIRGVNRHEHDEYNAKTLTTEEMARDVHLLKQFNFNAVRTCHYPDDERWYELCDRYGIYLLDEANIENHAYYDNITRSDAWTYAYMARVQRMVRRDKNHASIFGWSLGNESGDGANQVSCSAWIRRVDPTRIVHYEGFVRPERTQGDFTLDSLARGKGLTDLISPMYPSIDLIVQYVEERDDYRPIIMCEYSHAMGNANGSLSDYWEAIENHHGLQGGFIWDWIDQGMADETPAGGPGESQGGKFWKYGGDYGDTPTDYDFCLNGLNLPDQTPKPAMYECKRLFAPVRLHALHAEQGTFRVQNKADFTKLDNLMMHWFVCVNGVCVKDGAMKLPSVEPGKTALVSIPAVTDVRKTCTAGEEIILRADFAYAEATDFAPAGFILTSDSFVVTPAVGMQNFAKDTGTSKEGEAQSLAGAFQPSLFRAMIENEGIKRQLNQLDDDPMPWCFYNKPIKEWIHAGIQDVKIARTDDGTFTLGNFGTCTTAVSAGTAPDGSKAVVLNAVFSLNASVAEYPRVGLTAPVSADFTDVRWYGCGPQECYSDRKFAALRGMYKEQIANLEVPYIVPQENGSRCDVNYVELTAADGRKLHIQSMTPFTFSILRYDVQDLFRCHHHNELVDLTKGKNGHWVLSIDAAHRGVGTGACGPDTMEAYRVRPGVYQLQLIIW